MIGENLSLQLGRDGDPHLYDDYKLKSLFSTLSLIS